MDLVEVAKVTSALPLTVLLILVLVGGYAEWWIYGTIHRASLIEKEQTILLERGRADRWEARFLDVGTKIDTINHAVNGSSVEAAKKLTALETQIAALHVEVSRIQSLRVQDAQRSEPIKP